MSEAARIDSPDVLKEFRKRFVDFDLNSRNALLGNDAAVRGTLEWLKGEQLVHWKTLLRKREEALNTAVRDLDRLRMTATWSLPTSGVDEKRAIAKAKRLKEEAETKIDAVKQWTLLLDQKARKLMGPCLVLGQMLDLLTPRALARLDQMIVSLEEYLRTSPGGAP